VISLEPYTFCIWRISAHCASGNFTLEVSICFLGSIPGCRIVIVFAEMGVVERITNMNNEIEFGANAADYLTALSSTYTRRRFS
jgi:alanine-alpha-ketoisovalerate/valine-pyruvate aminotransferase